MASSLSTQLDDFLSLHIDFHAAVFRNRLHELVEKAADRCLERKSFREVATGENDNVSLGKILKGMMIGMMIVYFESCS